MLIATPTERSIYVGRFAPSPTGELHQGSLLAAVVSYLEAKQQSGKWLVRMEDLDPPREQAGAASAILRSLEAHGLNWDGSVLFQSSRAAAYAETLHWLDQQHLTFACTCTRQRMIDLHGVYDGHCRFQPPTDQSQAAAIRLKINSNRIEYNDLYQGFQHQELQRDLGDFILRRKDGLIAYQLAVVVDDIFQGITHVVRGSDLIDSTPRQLFIFDTLKAARPTYAHVPIIVDHDGQKLSKQTFAEPLNDKHSKANSMGVLQRLKMNPPDDLAANHNDDILSWAIEHWRRDYMPNQLRFKHNGNSDRK